MILSFEQLQIVYSNEDILLIDAFAGTGKTSTLIEFSKENIDKNILYLVFNKEMRKDSKHKFPLNTEIHTINSFIFSKTKHEFEKRKMLNEYNIHFVLNNLTMLNKLIKTEQKKAIEIAVNTLSELNNFFNSLFEEEDYFKLDINNIANYLAGELYKKIKNENLPITHNFLMKHFIDNYDFNSLNYDFLLIDEAQDINPAMLNIIKKIKSKKIFVGDKRQNIYGFRDSINIFSLKEFEYTPKLFLTGSFRFGSNIANIVNKIVFNLYRNTDKEIIGLNKYEGVIVEKQGELKGPYTAYITRTNAHLFDKAFELIESGKKVSIPFDWELIKNLLLDVFYLRNGLKDRIKTDLIKNYHDFNYFKNIAESGGDLELSFLIKIIEKYNLDIPEKIKQLEKYLSSPKYADIILLTAHKSKGLEFYNVIIGEDFPELSFGLKFEEKNLIYVALTRAMEKLCLNENIKKYLKSFDS